MPLVMYTLYRYFIFHVYRWTKIVWTTFAMSHYVQGLNNIGAYYKRFPFLYVIVKCTLFVWDKVSICI